MFKGGESDWLVTKGMLKGKRSIESLSKGGESRDGSVSGGVKG